MFKKIWSKIFIQIQREIKRNKLDVKTSLSLSQIRFLMKYPKFEIGEIKFWSKKLIFSDSSSFLHTLNEIYIDEVYFFKSNISNPLIIDLGSNIGLSVLYFKKIYPDSEIICFEPDPKIFKLLEQNIQTYEIQNVKTYMSAAWKFDGEVSFFSEGALSGSINKIEGAKEIKVTSMDVNKIIKHRKIDFLKIDIEGGEFELLLHIKECLGNTQRIFVEYHDKKESPQQLHLLLQILTDAGFVYYIKQESDSIKHPFTNKSFWNFNFQLNIFAFRLLTE